MNDLTAYDELVARHNAAYAAHVEMWRAKHPEPVYQEPERSDGLVLAALVVMALAAVIVSGSRTVLEFGGGAVGIAAFVMIELGLIGSAYITARRNYSERRHRWAQSLAWLGMALAFCVAVAANVHAVVRGPDAEPTGEGFDLIIRIVLGFSAPLLALVSGELLATEVVARSSRERKARVMYDTAKAQWQTECNRAFEQQKARLGVRVEVQRESVSAPRLHTSGVSVLSEQTADRQTTRTGYGHNRTSDGQARVVEYLNANPEAVGLTLRELGMLAGVNKDTASAGRRRWQTERVDVEPGQQAGDSAQE